MTLKDNVQVNSELLPFFKTVCSSCDTFLRKTNNDYGTGHEKQEFVCFSKSTPFYDTEQ